jgi:hypothetical protein
MRRFIRLGVVAALLAGLAGPPADTAAADCCMTAPPVRADFNIRFPEHAALAALVIGQVASVAPSAYIAHVTVLLGGAIGTSALKPILTLAPITGRSTPIWSSLPLRFTTTQRRHIRSAARRAHRRPVLDVRVSGVLPGHSTASSHARQFVLLPGCGSERRAFRTTRRFDAATSVRSAAGNAKGTVSGAFQSAPTRNRT